MEEELNPVVEVCLEEDNHLGLHKVLDLGEIALVARQLNLEDLEEVPNHNKEEDYLELCQVQ